MNNHGGAWAPPVGSPQRTYAPSYVHEPLCSACSRNQRGFMYMYVLLSLLNLHWGAEVVAAWMWMGMGGRLNAANYLFERPVQICDVLTLSMRCPQKTRSFPQDLVLLLSRF
eukprot:50113-Pyramimonas_sp.AAC.1